MSILLCCLGAICFVGGLVMAGFGIAIELSFGNTLIMAGDTTAVGGLIVFALGAVVSQLQQIVDAGAPQPAVQPHRPLESLESAPATRPAAGRIPFPPKPKAEARETPASIAPVEAPAPSEPMAASAPTLPNPDETPVTVAETVSLSPPQPSTEPANLGETFEEPAPEPEQKTAFDKEWPLPEPAPQPERRS